MYEILQYEKEIICSSYYEQNFSYAEKVVCRCNYFRQDYEWEAA